jgi:salicylate hydroxylase
MPEDWAECGDAVGRTEMSLSCAPAVGLESNSNLVVTYAMTPGTGRGKPVSDDEVMQPACIRAGYHSPRQELAARVCDRDPLHWVDGRVRCWAMPRIRLAVFRKAPAGAGDAVCLSHMLGAIRMTTLPRWSVTDHSAARHAGAAAIPPDRRGIYHPAGEHARIRNAIIRIKHRRLL